jgi:hypothetical protein
MTPPLGGWAFRRPLAAFRRFRQTLAVFSGAPAYHAPHAPPADSNASFRQDDGMRVAEDGGESAIR